MAEERVVTDLPLDELWNDEGIVTRERRELISVPELKRLLDSDGDLHVALAWIGAPIRWVRGSGKAGSVALLETPEMKQRFIVASRWEMPDGESIILLELHLAQCE